MVFYSALYNPYAYVLMIRPYISHLPLFFVLRASIVSKDLFAMGILPLIKLQHCFTESPKPHPP